LLDDAKNEKGLVDVLTFDTHSDFWGGFITQGDFRKIWPAPRSEQLFASKYKQDEEVKHLVNAKHS
jgi:hypothetical protein